MRDEKEGPVDGQWFCHPLSMEPKVETGKCGRLEIGIKIFEEGKMCILCRKVDSEKVLVIACARRSCFAGCFADTPKRRHTSERTHQRSCKAEQNNQQKRVSPDHGRFRKLVKCSIVPNHTIPDPAIAIDLLDHIQTQLQLVTSKLK